jgi:hypothetical protein
MQRRRLVGAAAQWERAKGAPKPTRPTRPRLDRWWRYSPSCQGPDFSPGSCALNRRLVSGGRSGLVASGRSSTGLAREPPGAFGPGLRGVPPGRRPAAVWLNRGVSPVGSRSRHAGCGFPDDRENGTTDHDHRGVDPHKSAHTATAVDSSTNTTVASLRIGATLAGYRELLAWARQFGERRWTVEKRQGPWLPSCAVLLARDETVFDVAAVVGRDRHGRAGGQSCL